MRSEVLNVALAPHRAPATRVRDGAVSAAGSWLAVADQILFSGANFLAGVLLARWMHVESYGAFALAFAIVYVLSAVHDALLLEPSSILGPGRFSSGLPGYFAGLLAIHVGITALLGAGLAVSAIAVTVTGGSRAVAAALVGAGLALPALLLVWLIRRLAYVAGRPGAALATSGIYVAVSLLTLALVAQRGAPNPVAAFAALAVAALAASAPAIRAVRRGLHCPLEWRSILGEHWRYGRWVVLTALAYAGAQQVQILFVGARIGLAEAGALRAMQLLTLPMIQAVSAVSALALPQCVRDRAEGNADAARLRTLRVTAALTFAAAVYAAVLVVFTGPLDGVVFGGRFAGELWLARALAPVPLLFALAAGLSLRARSSGRLTYYVAMAAVATPVAAASTIGLTLGWGLRGAAASTVLTAAAVALVAVALYVREGRRP